MSKSFKECYLILGPTGYGKSSTANSLIDDNSFTTGNDIERITEDIKFCQSNTKNPIMVIDTPGFADPNDELIFLTEMIKIKEKILKIGLIKIILVIKFDLITSNGFLKASKDLKKYFGTEVLKSLLILGIQVNEKKIFSNGEFSEMIRNSDGYLFLKNFNNGQEIQYCLWDNIRPYRNQEVHFQNCIRNLEPYDKKSLVFAFDLIANEKENLIELKKKIEAKEQEIELLKSQKNEMCNIF